MVECAGRLGLSLPRVALAWLLTLGIPVVVKSLDPAHLADDMAAQSVVLDEACMSAISAAEMPAGARPPKYAAESAPLAMAQ